MPRVEAARFHWEDPRAMSFYQERGYVIVTDVLTSEERQSVRPAWDEVVAESAEAAGLVPAEFEERFPQNRDLWSKSTAFRELLFQSRQGQVAGHFLGTEGARLFHDHAILKPQRRSHAIPWHQDSAYWPVDRVGNSLWTPTGSVSERGGCLKVLAGSHLDGPGTPQDFLRPDGVNRDDDDRVIYLPVDEGETVVLSGLTWHGSDPNHSPDDRLAYLTLWIPGSARFAPLHADWHPTTAHIDVEPGAVIEGEWFPLFGVVGPMDEGQQVAFPSPETGFGLTMFRASDAIREQLAWLAGRPDAEMSDLVGPDGRDLVTAGAARLGLDSKEVSSALQDLELQELVRKRSVARDVYLSTVQRWWHVAGHVIEHARR